VETWELTLSIFLLSAVAVVLVFGLAAFLERK